MNDAEIGLMSLTVRPSKPAARMKHNGINATREALKDQLVLAADEIIRLRATQQWFVGHVAWLESLPLIRPLARLARWVRGIWA